MSCFPCSAFWETPAARRENLQVEERESLLSLFDLPTRQFCHLANVLDMAGTEIKSWVKKFSDPNFPWKTLEEEVDYDEDEEDDKEEDDKIADQLAVDPLAGWQRQVLKVEDLK